MKKRNFFSENLCSVAAKSYRETPDKWLPFIIHAMDTGGIMEKLFIKWLPEHVRNELALSLQPKSNPEIAITKVCEFCRLLALLHDVGKITPVFQNKIAKSIEGHFEFLTNLGFNLAVMSDSYSQKSPHQLAGQAILNFNGFPEEFSEIVGSHHGRGNFGKAIDQFEDYSYNYFGIKNSQKNLWIGLWNEWISFALNDTGFTVDTLPKPDIKSQMLLTGLLIMSDWIASNTYYFPYVSIDDLSEEKRVKYAFDRLDLPCTLELHTVCDNPQVFADKFSFKSNFMQNKIMEIVSQNDFSGLYILEAPMGLGKTEAALSAAEILIDKCGLGGIYFGLPTQATANGIFGRIREWASKCDTETHSIRLAHGMTELNEEYQSMFHGTASSYADDNVDEDNNNSVIVHTWFEGRKQALLADFVIATIDQFLLASLKQKHVMLRHLGLAGKVVILDECHAYDAYMNIYLDHTLTWMGAYNVPVIILSATLPAKRRAQLVKAYLNMQKLPTIDSISYPVLTYTTKDNNAISMALPCEIPEKVVAIREIEESNLSSYIKEKLCGEGCAAVIVNTVAYAQLLSDKLASELNDYEIICFHSRFIASDRAKIEHTLLNCVGKNSTSDTRKNLIVVGTQVIEQSLDLDFDTMITELCPMDLLLQRSGRLHRHNRTRPSNCKEPVLAILKPSDDKRNKIYYKWILEQTKRYLPDKLVIPSCIPELVNKVYNEPSEEDKNSDTYQEYIYDIKEKERNAEKYCIKSNNLGSRYNKLLSKFVNDEVENSTKGEAAVRDIDDTIEVLVLIRKDNGHYSAVSEDRIFDTTYALSDIDKKFIAHERLRLPRIFSNSWEIISKELDIIPKKWRETGLLKGELLLLLNENMETELLNKKLRYSKERGLELINQE